MGQKITDLDIHDGAVWCETEGPNSSHGKSKYMSSPSSYGRMFAFDAEGQYLLSCGSESGVVYKVSLKDIRYFSMQWRVQYRSFVMEGPIVVLKLRGPEVISLSLKAVFSASFLTCTSLSQSYAMLTSIPPFLTPFSSFIPYFSPSFLPSFFVLHVSFPYLHNDVFFPAISLLPKLVDSDILSS